VDTKDKLIVDETTSNLFKLDKKIVSVDSEYKAYNEIQDKRVENCGLKIKEIASIQSLTREKLDKTIKRLVSLETSFNSLNFDLFLKKEDLNKYKIEVLQLIEDVKSDALDKFILKEVAYKLLSKADNDIQSARGELNQ